MSVERTLLWMRHAKSSWKTGLPDPERPLNARGQRDAPRMALALDSLGLRPDFLLCSDAERTRETRVWMEHEWGVEVPGKVLASLYLASPDGLMEAVAGHVPPQARVAMVLAHNPGIEEVVARCSGQPEAMPTAAVAVLRLPSGLDWADLVPACGKRALRLERVLRPRSLEDGASDSAPDL